MSENIRIGCLGAARIAPAALIRPARKLEGVVVSAVAARDPLRADAFARKHGIPKTFGSYQELVESEDIDAVYIPLPNGLHAKWALAAIDAGKHVLCEKPFAANAGEAKRVIAAAAGTGLVVMEAFHWRYHPMASRMLEVISSGELGEIQKIEASFVFPLPRFRDIRWELRLAGGSLMDAGCYAVHIVRTLAGTEPVVESASSRLRSPGIDRWITAEFDFPGEPRRSGGVTAGMWSGEVFRMHATVTGERGVMKVLNPIAPQFFNLIRVRTGNRTRRERVRGKATYDYQLEAFAAAVRDGAPILTGSEDIVANMEAIDAIYTAAGLEPRKGATDAA